MLLLLVLKFWLSFLTKERKVEGENSVCKLILKNKMVTIQDLYDLKFLRWF